MKNIGIIIAVFVIILLVAAGGVLFLKYAKAPTAPQTESAKTQSAKPTNNSVDASILSLLSGGKTESCAITFPDNKGAGSVFVADKKFAGDFTTKGSDGKETTGHVISDGTYLYIWSSAMPTGIKMNLADAKNATQNAQANQAIDINQKASLNCSPWLPDNSKFVIPTNIKFSDMSQFLQNIQSSQPKVTNTNSSACDQIPAGPAKTACLNALQSSGQ